MVHRAITESNMFFRSMTAQGRNQKVIAATKEVAGSHRTATGRERRADLSHRLLWESGDDLTYIGAPLPSGRGSVAAIAQISDY
ncbi:MAG TPA: hypothetical protein VGQ81_13300 [Acidobacteriota bacterium]|nr:hypothetical protein [Acidobacteriota bacterium]